MLIPLFVVVTVVILIPLLCMALSPQKKTDRRKNTLGDFHQLD